MANKINFSDYRASGVYFLEIDNSVISTSSSRTALRMAVGFNMRGPFNRPVYVAGADDCNKFFGPIDRRLERQGCFTNRMVRTMVRKAPVYVLNLLKTTDADKVGCWFLPFGTAPAESDASTGKWEFETRYDDMYDRTKFWMADDRAFVNNAFKANSYTSDLKDAPFYAVGNCGTKDISVIVKKADVTGYNVTFLEYYGSKDEIPYKWINPNDYVSDYFVDVVLYPFGITRIVMICNFRKNGRRFCSYNLGKTCGGYDFYCRRFGVDAHEVVGKYGCGFSSLTASCVVVEVAS